MQITKTETKIHILNPAAGKGKAVSRKNEFFTASEYASNSEGGKYITKSVGDAENFVYECCKINPHTHFVVHGGDGTINEVINGIIKAEASESATFSVVPFGTGNDFVKNFGEKEIAHCIDVIKYNDRYAVNMINIGFDCSVAYETSKLKRMPLVSGSMAYILGVMKVFFRQMWQRMEITFTDEDGITHKITDDVLLCAVSNGSYCGGGFKSSPHSSVNDGHMEILIVKKIPRLKFVLMINKYRSGTHISSDSLLPIEKLRKYLIYKKCKTVSIKNLNRVCADGEVEDATSFNAEIVPLAITYIS